MGLLDKLSDAKNKVASMANDAKVAYDQKKEEKAEYNAQMKEKADNMVQEIYNKVTDAFDENDSLLFDEIDYNCAMTFSKEFYEKMVLPGGKTGLSCLSMNPYLDEKKLSKIGKKFSSYDMNDKPLLYFKDSLGQQIVFTTKGLYFQLCLEDDNKFFGESVITTNKINNLSINITETHCQLLCNNVMVASIKIANGYKQDFISVDEYFKRLKNNDFEISYEQIDALIKKKIGDKIYDQVKKYFVDDDEIVLYYAGGLDSLTANDYVACTSNQIIILNREFGGMTADVKQFYYEDITAAKVNQNTNSGDLAVDLICSAITAATKTCDLILSVAGSSERISTLYTIEAERVVSIYHEKRKEKKEDKKMQQITVVNQSNQTDIADQIKKIKELLDIGVISEEEFNQKKAELLAKM